MRESIFESTECDSRVHAPAHCTIPSLSVSSFSGRNSPRKSRQWLFKRHKEHEQLYLYWGNGPSWGQWFPLRNGELRASTHLQSSHCIPQCLYMFRVYKQLVFWLLPATCCCLGPFLSLEFSTTFECFMREIWQRVTWHLMPSFTCDLGFQRLKVRV